MAKRQKVRKKAAAASAPAGGISVLPLAGLPEVRKGNDLAKLIDAAARRAGTPLADGDVVVVAQKIVSKAEGCIVHLARVRPSAAARTLGKQMGHDARFVQVVLSETRRIVRESPHVLVVETHHGLVCANAGVDRSNVPGRDVVSLLPKDPDASAKRLRAALRKRTGKRVAVIISDTFGRAWRLGLVEVAIGAAGLPVLTDLRGSRDRTGKRLHATILAVADELAAAAGLCMGKAEGVPVVIIRGHAFAAADEPAAKIIRPAREDLFR
jgi:coenzyme F420-0:L-glutamate ligase/coenzyme F420-1:gamma-L-glutamate ligase